MITYVLLRRGALRSGEVMRFQIRAGSEQRAREMASEHARVEGAETWLSDDTSACLATTEETEMILDVEVMP